MKNSFKLLTFGAAVILLTALFGIGSVLAKQIDISSLGQLDASHAPQAVITVAENTVEWTDSSGVDITHVNASTTAYFYITDDALETTHSGTAVYAGHASTATYFDVPAAKAGTTSSNATTTTSVTRTGTTYSTSTPAGTPWTGIPTVTVSGDGTRVVTSYNVATGVVAVSSAATTATTTVGFTYHVADEYLASSSTARRVKITSSSDTAGEYATINEVASVGSSTADPDSQVFLGTILLSDNAATQGTNSDGIWVQDGDTLTVNYLDASAVIVDSDTITVDAVDPSISAITPADDSVTGTNNPSITFEVTDLGAGISSTPGDDIAITIYGVGATSTIASTTPAYQPISDGYKVIFTQNISWLLATGSGGYGVSDSVPFTWKIVASDKAGNSKTSTIDLEIDVTKPTLSSALTGTAWDADDLEEDTEINTSVKVVFSEPLDSSTVAASDFTVAGVVPTDAAVGTGSASSTVYLTVAALDPDAKPEVIVTGTVSDDAGNAVDVTTSLTTNDAIASDGLKPAITNTISQGLSVDDDEITFTVVATEKLAVGGLVVSLNGPSGAAGNGTITTTAPSNPLSQEGTLTVAAGGTGMYGASIQATDLGANAANNLTTVTAEVVPIASVSYDTANLVATITLAKGPIADLDFDGDVDASDITTVVLNSSSTVAATSIGNVNASARTFTVTHATARTQAEEDAETATVTYKYVKTDIFEIDNAKPTATFDPDGVSDIENARPFINVIWDEDEYPGDSHTTVTLTKATLTDPDAVITDILAEFSTTDNKKFIYLPTNDLALGDYTLTVSAKDDALNEKKDQTVTFTIVEKALESISLRPGWNLISLPGSPADGAINTVITVAAVDTVLTYDPTVPGNWLTAVRDTDGTLAGTLTTIDASHAYWVHTDTFDPIKVDIPGLAGGALSLPPSIVITKGWNLVPAISLDPDFATADSDDYFTGLSWTRGYRYNTESGKFETFKPTLTTNTADAEIATGVGYWLFASEAGDLLPLG